MMRAKSAIPVVVLLLATAAGQQQHRDPLNDLEIDKLRDAALLPEIRLKLYVDFARARLDNLEKVRADTKAEDREKRTRDALQDFLDLYDELDDNVNTFSDRRDDLRKALKPVIEADTEFGAKLRAFRASLASTPKEAESYAFLLGSALDTVDAAAKDHRDLLAEQEEAFKNRKKQGHKDDSQKPE